jgi:hypothetical protein
LLIPMAIWLGRNFGRRGLATLLIGAPLLLSALSWSSYLLSGSIPPFANGVFVHLASWLLSVRIFADFGSVGFASGIVPLALLLAWIATKPDPLDAFESLFRGRRWIALGVCLLPWMVYLWIRNSGWAQLHVSLQAMSILCFIAFAAGYAQVKSTFVLRLLMVAMLLGLVFAFLYPVQSPRDDIELSRRVQYPLSTYLSSLVMPHYMLSTPAVFLALLAYYWTGNLLRRNATGIEPTSRAWRHPYSLVFLLMLLWAGAPLNAVLVPESSRGLQLDFFGSDCALPLGGLAAGLLLRYRGICWSASLAILLLILGYALTIVGVGGGGLFDLAAPLVVISYGLLGIQIRSMAHEKATGVPSEPRFRFVALGKLLSWRWLATALLLVMLQLAPGWIAARKEEWKYMADVQNWALVHWLDTAVQFAPALVFVVVLAKTLLSVGELIDDVLKGMEALASGTAIRKILTPIRSVATSLLRAIGLRRY